MKGRTSVTGGGIAAGNNATDSAGRLLLAFYGDDFTGSTDALEFLNKAGARTVLFMEPPGAEMLARYPGLRAIGIAGTTRSMRPAEMEKTLKPAFSALNLLEVQHIHYKVCSTFDSSPAIGSIGKAIDLGAAIFSSAFIPVLAAAPALGRYCLFGNLFARLGTGKQGPVYRLDRHPSMSRHPVTPASESDLLVHLSRQTGKKSGLVDILQVAGGAARAREALEGLRREGAEIILIDALQEAQLPGIGELIDSYAGSAGKVFSVGSSGIEMALGAFWAAQGRLPAPPSWAEPGRAEPMLVVSGSCSPVTRQQIEQALRQGFQQVELDGGYAAEGNALPAVVAAYAPRVCSLLKAGKSVVLHTGRKTRTPQGNSTSIPFGKMLGCITRTVLEEFPLERMVIAGGDTSGEVARELGIEALEMIAPLTSGAPLCRAHAPGSAADGITVSFKGGQVGTPEFLRNALEGIPSGEHRPEEQAPGASRVYTK